METVTWASLITTLRVLTEGGRKVRLIDSRRGYEGEPSTSIGYEGGGVYAFKSSWADSITSQNANRLMLELVEYSPVYFFWQELLPVRAKPFSFKSPELRWTNVEVEVEPASPDIESAETRVRASEASEAAARCRHGVIPEATEQQEGGSQAWITPAGKNGFGGYGPIADSFFGARPRHAGT